MYQVYHSQGGTNHYEVREDELDTLIEDARTSSDQSYRKAVYKECLDYIVDYAVEIPTYQRQNGVVYSTERVNTETLVKDPSPFYIWMDELYTLEMK